MTDAAVVTRGAASGMRAVILAGGKGTRLRPFTINFPKPLVPLGDTPVLENLIHQLLEFGISDITLTLGHLAELVQAYLTHRRSLTQRLNLNYVIEDEPTGTAGSLASVAGLDSTFLVMNGDLLTDLDIHEFVRFHKQRGAALTIATHRREIKIDLGVLNFDSQGRVVAYQEKPRMDYHVSMGIYVYEPRVLRYIQRGSYLDFPDLVRRLIGMNERVLSYVADCMWLDIGRPDDYARAQELYTNRNGQVTVA